MCSLASGQVRFTRLLRFIFAILIVDGRRERRYSVRIRWCCTHRPSRSVTETEEPLIVASRASINSYLERAGKQSAMRTSIISLDPQTIALRAWYSRATCRSVRCTVGDREDSTTSRRVQVERSDSHRVLNRCEQPSGSAPRSPMSVSGPHQRF